MVASHSSNASDPPDADDHRLGMEQRGQGLDIAIVSGPGIALEQGPQLLAVGHRTATGFTGTARAADDTERPHGEEELPAVERGAPFTQAGRGHVVDQVQAHGRDPDLMHGEGPLLRADEWHGIGYPIAAEDGHAAVLKPGEALGVQSGESVERPGRLAPRLATPGHDQHVARAHPDVLRRFGQLEVGDRDDLSRTEEVRPEGTRDVEEDAPPDDAVGHRKHGVRAGPVAAHLTGRPAAEHLPPHEHVRKRVDMGRVEAVQVQRQVIACRLVARYAVRVAGIARGEHVVLDRIRVFGKRLGGQVMGQADRFAASDQRGGASAVLLGHVVQRATLVVGPPTAPVLEILVHPIEGLGRGDVIVTCHGPSLSADAVRCPHGAEEHLDQIVDEAVVGEDEPLAPPTQFARPVGGGAADERDADLPARPPQVGGDFGAALP